MPMQHTKVFNAVKNDFFSVENICLSEAVLTCTHTLCLGTKIPLRAPVLLLKCGIGGGALFTDMFA